MKIKIGKKILPVLLTLLLLIGLVPTAAFAANNMSIYVGDTDIVNSGTHTIQCGNGTATYDTNSKVLTLDNATLTSDKNSEAVIRGTSEVFGVNPEVKIVVKGENTITAPMAIDFKGANLSFSGPGKLIINGKSVGIRSRVYNDGSGGISFSDGVTVDVKIEGGDPNTSAAYWGWPAICANGKHFSVDKSIIRVENKGGRGIAATGVSITDSYVESIVDTTTPAGHDYCAFLVSNGGLQVENSTLTAKVVNGSDTGIFVNTGDITFENSTVTGSAVGAGYGIRTSQFAGAFTINGGTVNGSGTVGIGYFGSGDLSLYGGAQVTATGTASHGLYSHQAAATVAISGEGTKVTAKSSENLGVYSIGSISLSDEAYVEASGKSCNLYSQGAISISDSTLDAGHASNSRSVWAANALSITGASEVTAMGIGSADSFTVEPAAGRSVEVKTGSSESDAKHIEGSPFDVKTTLSNYSSDTFFRSSTHNHNPVHVEAVSPTAVKPGNIEYWHCPDCGMYFKDAALKEVISKEQTVIAPAGETKPGTSEPEEISSDTEKNEATDNPQTGDSGNPSPWVSLLIVSIAGAVGTTIYSRKRKYNK